MGQMSGGGQMSGRVQVRPALHAAISIPILSGETALNMGVPSIGGGGGGSGGGGN